MQPGVVVGRQPGQHQHRGAEDRHQEVGAGCHAPARLLVTPLLLVTAGLAAVRAAAAEPAPSPAPSPVPSPAWSTDLAAATTGSPSGETRIDTFGASTHLVTGIASTGSTSATSYAYDVYDATGRRTFHDAGGADAGASLDAVDAGAWGAVAGGTVAGEVVPGAGAGGDDGWVRRYAPDGTVAWTTQLGTGGDDAVADVVVLGDTVVAVGSLGTGDGVLLYTLDLATGAATGPLAIDVDPQEALLSRVVVVGSDLVVRGETDRDLDGLDTEEPHEWLARLDGADPTRVVWETDGSGAPSTAAYGVGGLTVVGSNLYTTSGFTFGAASSLASFDATTGIVRWSKALGVASTHAVTVVPYRGGVAVGGAVVSDPDVLDYDSLLQGWSASGKRLWRTRIEEDTSVPLTFVTGLAYGATQGLVATGISSPTVATTGSYPGFLTGLKIRAPRTLVTSSGGVYGPSAVTVVRRGRTGTAVVRLTNIGEVGDMIGLKGCVTPASVTLTVRAGRKDVTRAVRNGSYRTPSLAAGKSTALSVAIKVGPKAHLRTIVCDLVSSSVANPTNTSTAVLKIAVRK